MYKNTNHSILTPKGWSNFTGIQRISKEGKIHLKTNKSELICSPKHRIKIPNGWEIAENLNTFANIETKSGTEVILSIEYISGTHTYYDIIDTLDNEYYTNDIVSHNCEFLGSAHTLINPSKIRTIAFVDPLRTTDWGLQVWEEPRPKRFYQIVVDTSHGVGQDYSVASVIDITEVPYKLVAKYRSNETSPMIFPEIIAKAGKMYNNSMVLVETNDVGLQIADALHTELEYEGVLSTVLKGRAGQKISSGFSGKSNFGIRTTAQVKKIGCSNIKDLIESDKLLINDFDTVAEMSTFVRKGPSYQAEEGATDDIMMTLVLFGWLVRQAFFKEITDTNVRQKIVEEQFADFYEDVMPAGIIDDGETIKSISRSKDSWLFDDPEL